MDLQRLEVFVAVAETGSMTAAARQVHLTQPAVSRNIKQLEEQLGAELFERLGRGLSLTSAGRALLDRAPTLLEQVRLVERHTRRAAERDYFDVRVGTVGSIATFLFGEVVAPMREAFPDIELKFYTSRTIELLRQVRAGELDIAIVAWSGTPDFERCDRIGRYDLQFYGRRDIFPDLAEVTTEDELRNFPIVQLEPTAGQPTLIGDDMPSFALAHSLATVKSLVMGGFGVGSLLHFMLDAAERDELARAQVPHDPDCGVYLVASKSWRSGVEDDIRREMVAALRGVFPDVAD